MKKKVIGIIAIIVIISAIIGLIYASSVLKGKENNLDKRLIDLKYSELQEKIDNKDSFILVVSKTDCEHCIAYKPVLKEVLADHDLTAYEIRIDTLSKEELNSFSQIANITGTPTTIFIVDGEEKSTSHRLIGEADKTKIENRLKALGYIN